MADAFNRRTLMLISTLGLIGTAALFTVQAALGLNNPWLILGLFAIQQAFFAINQPTRTAVLPQLLPKHLLPAANSLNMTVMQFGAIAGAAAGRRADPGARVHRAVPDRHPVPGRHPLGGAAPAVAAPRRVG